LTTITSQYSLLVDLASRAPRPSVELAKNINNVLGLALYYFLLLSPHPCEAAGAPAFQHRQWYPISNPHTYPTPAGLRHENAGPLRRADMEGR